MAHHGMRDYEAAWLAFDELYVSLTKGGLPYLLVCPLLNARGECAIARNDLSAASAAARELLENAERCRENTYVARAHRLLAETALSESDLKAAAGHIERAFATLASCEANLAEWRIHAVAARVFGRMGRDRESGESRERARAAAKRVADTLETEPPLQRSFLARAVAELESAAASA